MKNTSIHYCVIVLADEKEENFIRETQYSQGYFDYLTTDSPFDAIDFSKDFNARLKDETVVNSLMIAMASLSNFHPLAIKIEKKATRSDLLDKE